MDEADDAFEIHDFTDASDWEKFTSCLTDLLTQWRESLAIEHVAGHTRPPEFINFADAKYHLQYFGDFAKSGNSDERGDVASVSGLSSAKSPTKKDQDIAGMEPTTLSTDETSSLIGCTVSNDNETSSSLLDKTGCEISTDQLYTGICTASTGEPHDELPERVAGSSEAPERTVQMLGESHTCAVLCEVKDRPLDAISITADNSDAAEDNTGREQTENVGDGCSEPRVTHCSPLSEALPPAEQNVSVNPTDGTHQLDGRACAGGGHASPQRPGNVLQDIMSHDRAVLLDCASRVRRLFGVRRFLELSPCSVEADCRLVISSARMALADSKCGVPLLVRIGSSDTALQHTGFCVVDPLTVVHFDNLRFSSSKSWPSLSDWVRVFRGKLTRSEFAQEPSMRVSACRLYDAGRLCALCADTSAQDQHRLPDNTQTFMEEKCILLLARALRWRPFQLHGQLLPRLRVKAVWEETSESCIGAERSLLSADRFFAKIVGVEHSDERADKFVVHCNCKNDADDETCLVDEVCFSESFSQVFTDTLQDWLSGATGPRQSGSHEPASSRAEAIDYVCRALFQSTEQDDELKIPDFLPAEIKAHLTAVEMFPYSGLLWRLSTLLDLLFALPRFFKLHFLDQLSTYPLLVRIVLCRFVHVLRVYCLSGRLIDGLPLGAPDHRLPLLYQKFQLLNVCSQKILLEEINEPKNSSDKCGDSDNSDDVEFFDAQDEQPQLLVCGQEPSGRQEPFGSLTLLETGDQMYVPITQDMPPLTSDQLAQDFHEQSVEVEDGARSRHVQVLSARSWATECLKSDMISFQAANPGCTLADFVRWHSPRDWVIRDADDNSQTVCSDPTGRSGCLSARMRTGNGDGGTWRRMWLKCASVSPQPRRHCLFDAREQIMLVFTHYMRHLTVYQLMTQLVPVRLLGLFRRLLSQLSHAEMNAVSDELLELARQLKHTLLTEQDHAELTARHEAMVALLRKCHIKLNRWRSFVQVLGEPPAAVVPVEGTVADNDQWQQIARLLDTAATIVDQDHEAAGVASPDSDIGYTPVDRSLVEAVLQCPLHNTDTPTSNVKRLADEYLLTCRARFPADGSRSLPQRLHCHITYSESSRNMALSTSLTHDQLFH